MSQETYQCKRCGNDFTARTADRKRGWARYCSKSCKAFAQEASTGQFAAHMQREAISNQGRDAIEDGWDGHKNAL